VRATIADVPFAKGAIHRLICEVENARIVLVLVLDTVASRHELACESAGDAPCLSGAKFRVLPLSKVPGMGSNNTEEPSFLLCVAKALDHFDVFF
jgi:hypothetical protein